MQCIGICFLVTLLVNQGEFRRMRMQTGVPQACTRKRDMRDCRRDKSGADLAQKRGLHFPSERKDTAKTDPKRGGRRHVSTVPSSLIQEARPTALRELSYHLCARKDIVAMSYDEQDAAWGWHSENLALAETVRRLRAIFLVPAALIGSVNKFCVTHTWHYFLRHAS